MPGTVSLRLPTSVPFAGPEVLEFIGGRAISGIESWDGLTYRRSMTLPGGHGTVTLRAADDHVAADLRLADSGDLDTALQQSAGCSISTPTPQRSMRRSPPNP